MTFINCKPLPNTSEFDPVGSAKIWDNSWRTCFYYVMLVGGNPTSDNRVSYRKGLGWILCDAWEKMAPETKDIILG